MGSVRDASADLLADDGQLTILSRQPDALLEPVALVVGESPWTFGGSRCPPLPLLSPSSRLEMG
jgi:hypothetical protein